MLANSHAYSMEDRTYANASLTDPVTQEHKYNTRQTNLYRPVSSLTEVSKRLSSFPAPSLYNTLLQDVCGAAAGSFRRVLVEYLLNDE